MNLFQIFNKFLIAFYENNNKFPLTKEILNQTKLNFSSGNPNNFYILTSSTITSKCTVAKNLCKLCKQGFLSTRFSHPTLTKFISCRYLIPSDWKQIKYMKEILSL